MKIIFIDKIWQIKNIKKTNENVIFSLKPECSYLLQKNQIDYLDFTDFYEHKSEWKLYKDINDNLENIVKICDDFFLKSNVNFKKLNWTIFNDFSYIIKIWNDTLLFHSKVLSSLISEFNPKELEFSTKTKIRIDNEGLISDSVCIIEHLAKQNFNVLISYSALDINNNSKRIKFSFGQPKHLINRTLFQTLKNIFNYFYFIYTFKFKKIDHLGIGCDEILKKNNFINLNIFNIYPDKKEFLVNNNSNFLENLKIYIIKNKHFKFKNINYYFFIVDVFKFIIKRSDFYHSELKFFKKLIKRKRIKSFVFQTMAPFYYPVFIFRKIAKESKIPIITWTHGGYFTISNPGYDVVDYKFCTNHIGYGKYLCDLIKNKDIWINKLNNKTYNVDFVGSFRFDKIHRAKKKNITNSKKNITFFIGCQMNMNQFYYGYDRDDVVISIWKQQLEIIKTLYNHSDKFNIIIKDYPNGLKTLWKNIIAHEFDNKIEYISNEKKLNEVLQESDLNVFPWISTTFFESLYYDSDILLFDEDLFTKPFEKLKDEIIWSNNLVDFQNKIQQYLSDNEFYKFNKIKSRNYFINYENDYNSKTKKLKNILENLV